MRCLIFYSVPIAENEKSTKKVEKEKSTKKVEKEKSTKKVEKEATKRKAIDGKGASSSNKVFILAISERAIIYSSSVFQRKKGKVMVYPWRRRHKTYTY